MAKEIILLILAIFTLAESVSSSAHPFRLTKFGKIRGKWIEIKTHKENPSVAAFLGVPYAEAPSENGTHRFKNSEPWKEHWNYTRSAVKDGSRCPQLNERNEVIGNENCLFLNIFVPKKLKKDHDAKYPVLVFVHGGDFKRGGNNSTYYSPEYLMYTKIILVTVNYRLGAFGFFSTGDDAAPGNWGLKDIKLALHWIQENIDAFDGDANSVTLWGHDSGGVLVHILALSNKTEGLFHKYITSGGSSLAFHAVKTADNARLQAIDAAYQAECIGNDEMGKIMKCLSSVEKSIAVASREISQVKCIANEDTKILLNCIKNSTLDKITRLQSSTLRDIVFPSYEFTPTVEQDSKDAILNANPLTLIEKGQFRDIPWIVGLTKDEGLQISLGISLNDDKNSESLEGWIYYLESLKNLMWSLEDNISVGEVVDDFYFIENATTTYRSNMSEIGDAFYNWPVYRAVKLQSKLMNSSVYFYVLGYEGTFSGTYAIDATKRYGVSHGDDINYLFPYLNKVFDDLSLHNTGDDITMMHVMTEMWTSFVKTGVPQAFRTASWKPFQIKESYAQLGWGNSTDVEMKSNFLPDRMAFWEDLMDHLSLPIYMVEEEVNDDNAGAAVMMRTMVMYYLSFFTLWFVL
ncbi:venom carboxylesterase-6 [Cephus cinctus]|uniref:Venom carboxylesterase-6 n=1 Tax=Cephus cinctus TaxID=211228 RepID=A0AAJ7FP95_CEPCN|nr:venom carboxylesterase-6 [Cephus cinctus]